jgi:hypothetical protein
MSNPTALRVVTIDIGRGPCPIPYPRRSVPRGQCRVPGSDNDHSLQSYHYEKKDMGYAKRNKRHAQESMIQKKEKKRKIAHILERERDMVHEKKFIHHPPKISTHMHILIKVYDLFLLWIQPLTQQKYEK